MHERGDHPPASDRAPKIFSAAYYARLHAVERSHWYVAGMREVTRALLEAHGCRPAGRALDAGCGTGGTLEWLHARFNEIRTVGIDVAPAALRYAREHGDFRLLQASVAELPFRASSFDLVFSFDVLQHVPERDGLAAAVVSEAFRVLRPGGVLVIRAAATRWGDTRAATADGYHRYRLAELTGAVRAAGFTVLRATPANCVGSLLDDARRVLGRSRPGHAGDPGLGIRPASRPLLGLAQRLVMRGEAFYLRRLRVALPWGHALVVLARKEAGSGPGTR